MHEEMKPPSLSRERRELAWDTIKLLLATAAVFVLIGVLLHDRPMLAVWVLSGVTIIATVIYYGWQDYKWKKESWTRQPQENCNGVNITRGLQ